MSQQPLIITEVQQERLSEYVVMPESCDQNFQLWWTSLELTAEVQVRFPHEKHSNACKTSNSAKSEIMNDFFFICGYQLTA